MITPIEPEIVPCKICGEGTSRIATSLCDNCWEVIHRLRYMPAEWITKILAEVGYAVMLIKP